MAWDELSRVLCADSKSVVRLSPSPLVHEIFEFEILKNTPQNTILKIKKCYTKKYLECTRNSLRLI